MQVIVHHLVGGKHSLRFRRFLWHHLHHSNRFVNSLPTVVFFITKKNKPWQVEGSLVWSFQPHSVVCLGKQFVTNKLRDVSRTGVLMLVASVLYYELQPATELSIHFDDHFMTFSFGWCFWFCTVSGKSTSRRAFVRKGSSLAFCWLALGFNAHASHVAR